MQNDDKKMWQKNPQAQVGIMGGAFNPFHNGHLRHAVEVLERLRLSHIEFLPSAHHPHKAGLLPFELRVEFLRKAIRGMDFFSINTVENELPTPSYTINTLRAWREQNPCHTPYFLMGTEDFCALDTWHQGFELPRWAHLLIVSRHGGDANLVRHFAQKFWGDIYCSKIDLVHQQVSIDELVFDVRTLPCNDTKKTTNKGICGSSKHDMSFNSDNQVWHLNKTIETLGGIEGIDRLSFAIPNKGFCTYLHIPFIDISATQIRQLWAQEKSLHGLVPDALHASLVENKEMLKKYW